jgi:hypothetical protein
MVPLNFVNTAGATSRLHIVTCKPPAIDVGMKALEHPARKQSPRILNLSDKKLF